REQAAVLERPLDLHLELLEVEGLEQVVVRAGLHGLDRRLHGPVRRHDESDAALAHHLAALQDLEAASLRHLVVGDDDVEHLLLEPVDGLGPVASLRDEPPAVAKRGRDPLAQVLLVLGYQDLPHGPLSSSVTPIMGKRPMKIAPAPGRLSTSMSPW